MGLIVSLVVISMTCNFFCTFRLVLPQREGKRIGQQNNQNSSRVRFCRNRINHYLIMVEDHKSIGPEVGSSGGKNILFFLPTFFGKNQSINFFSARKKPQKTKPSLAKLFFSEKTTNQIRKNLMHKNAIFFAVSVP